MQRLRKRVLTIAGSDSGGGAGIQADLKTISAHGCYGLSVLTAITAQNTVGVSGIMDCSEEIVRQQLESVLSDIGTDAAKTGMVSRAKTIVAIAEYARRFQIENLVVDPVMVSKGGARLLVPEAVEALVEHLLPKARVITPNLDEVEEILGRRPTTVEEMETAAAQLAKRGPRAVLIKGGHLANSNECVDVLWDGGTVERFQAPRLDVRHTHGTGCTLSAAIACNLAMGRGLSESVLLAKEYLIGAMEKSYVIGRGIGPVNHLWRIENMIGFSEVAN